MGFIEEGFFWPCVFSQPSDPGSLKHSGCLLISKRVHDIFSVPRRMFKNSFIVTGGLMEVGWRQESLR